jgi:pimeloyl-ACP methyl ester carboxylesterase
VTTIRASVTSADGTRVAYQSLGSGEGVIVVGGGLRSGEDYLPLARVLARSFTVHVIDRRGRGASGPQGTDYGIAKECDDLLAVQAATGATAAFGHSYGGLVVLEAALRTSTFSRVAVYEPGVSVDGSIPTGWIPSYQKLLVEGDTRGAFASMVREGGYAPSVLSTLPLFYTRAILRFVIRGREWQLIEPLLPASLAEHEEMRRLEGVTPDRYASITARVLLLGGGRSPAFITTELFEVLGTIIPDSVTEILDGLDHTAPDEKAPELIAQRVSGFLT